MVPYIRKKPICALLLALLAVSLVEAVAHAQTGIVQKYYRDIGIVNDPDVIFAEQFETGTVNDISNRWTNNQNAAGMSLVSDIPSNSGGTRSLQMTSIGEQTPVRIFIKNCLLDTTKCIFVITSNILRKEPIITPGAISEGIILQPIGHKVVQGKHRLAMIDFQSQQNR
jgi:hypothetical protein